MNRIGLFLAAVCLAGPLEAQQIRIETGAGLTYGQATELVLRDGTYNNPVSRLVWPTPPAFLAEADLRIAWTDWTTTELGFRTAWQLLPGTVVDQDWNATTDSGLLIYGRSEHTGYLTALVEADAAQRFRLGNWEWLVGGRYRWTSWEAWNGAGTYQYASGTTSNGYSGAVLDYRQMWFLPYTGVGVTWDALGLSWSPEVLVGPYTWCMDRDDHNYAGSATKSFLDYPRGGVFGQVSLEAALPSGWGLRCSASGTWGAVGDMVTTSTSQVANTQYGVASQGAGAWYWETSMTIFVRN